MVKPDDFGEPTLGTVESLVVVSGVRTTTAFDSGDHQPLFVLSEGYREAELADTYLLVWTVLEWFTVLGRITYRGIDDLVEFVEDAVLFVGRQCIEIVLCLRGAFSRPPVVTHRLSRTAHAPRLRSSSVPHGCPPRLRGGR